METFIFACFFTSFVYIYIYICKEKNVNKSDSMCCIAMTRTNYTKTYTCACRIITTHKKDERHSLSEKIYLSLYLKGLCLRGSWRPNRIAIRPSVFLSCSPELLNRRPGSSAFCWVLAFSTTSCLKNCPNSKLTDFLSSPSYILVRLPTQYLPITGCQNVSLPPSLEWHVWSSSSGNNCHAVHGPFSSGASVCDCTMGF